MILDRLQISGFLSYKEKVDIDFSGFTLACISGANGAGKSSLLEAITWVLFGEARRRDDAIINLRTDTAEVILDFDYEGVRYQVQRSKTRDRSTILEFRVRSPEEGWQVLTEPTMRGTEELIRRTLHLDYETFINASFFLQGKADQFAQQRPGDRKRILSGILGLEIWESYREEATRRRKIFENDLLLIDNQLTEIEIELQQENERKARLTQLEKEVAGIKALFEARKTLLDQQRLIADRITNDRKQVDKQRSEVLRAQVELDRNRDDLHERRQEQENYRLRLQNEAEIDREVAAWEAARQELAEWETVAVNFHQYESQRQAPLLIIEGERARLQTELDSLLQKQAEMRALEESIPTLQQQVEEYKAAVATANEKLSARTGYESEMRSLLDEKAHARAENVQLKTEMDEIVIRLARLEEITGATCPTCEKPLTAGERQRLLEELNSRGTVKGDTYRNNQKKVEQCDTRYRELETELFNLQRVEAELKLQQRLFDSKSEELRLSQSVVDNWHEKGEQNLKEMTEKLRSANFAQDARRDLAAIDARLKELGYDSAAHENIRRAELQGRASQEKLLQLEQAKASLVPLEREIASLEKTVEKNEAHLATLTDELKQAEGKLELETASLPDIGQLELEYYEVQEQMNLAINDLGYTRNQVEVLDRQREQKGIKLEEKEELNEKITDLKTLERAFGKDGIPALLIEQALPDIESHANEILDRLSVGGMSVKFETQREFKDKKRGDRRETLDILIRDSTGERSYEMFSGGEAFRVNFAIRLALSRVLAHRAGARLQTLVIDEGFGSQDAEGRQRLVEAINMVGSEFEKILVITHLEELKDAFPARIEVIKTLSGSQVQVEVA